MPARTLVEYPTGSPVLASKVPLLPAIAFVVGNALFCACVLLICVGTDTGGPILGDRKGGRHAKAVRLAQLRLTSPAALIYEHFCPRSVEKSVSGDAEDHLLELDGSDEEVRIRVGVVESLGGGEEDGPGPVSYRFGMSTTGDRRERPDQVQDMATI